MKITQWSRLRLELHARHQKHTESLRKLSGPAFVEEIVVAPVKLDDGTPVIKDGMPVEETRSVRTLTKRGTALQSLRDHEKARANLLRMVR